ncbi:uncharacterized protein FOMMEDRAFT_165139 [Fomitiporia mediterranea MF3/22]|uniref:uncharacterized protein n=1 Tax=Fomitiporia mediterranea (strain MF3/22) TaxID=694068 RepID=UPI00044077DB|nr:uncharacterized protein FOMMEDRAFT_165139 [Fomitiporia mediterranea MF3/22]EJD08597.1 hypothetical protein FOMMEDRAFT_165139 [Fomitiporia mediterranea MF3/22]
MRRTALGERCRWNDCIPRTTSWQAWRFQIPYRMTFLEINSLFDGYLKRKPRLFQRFYTMEPYPPVTLKKLQGPAGVCKLLEFWRCSAVTASANGDHHHRHAAFGGPPRTSTRSRGCHGVLFLLPLLASNASFTAPLPSSDSGGFKAACWRKDTFRRIIVGCDQPAETGNCEIPVIRTSRWPSRVRLPRANRLKLS